MKSCILFSGGWDSVCVALKNESSDLLFIDYGQIYFENELIVVKKFAYKHNRKLIIRKLNLHHDIERRNFYLIMFAKKLGYTEIFAGNRNLFPLFDKYKDSNFVYLKMFAFLCNIKIKLPILMWNKKRIVKFVSKNTTIRPYNCYLNNNDYKMCTCSNCEELKSLQ